MAAAAFAAAALSAPRAQEGQVGQEPQEPAVFSARSDLVVLHAAVTDRQGAFVSGLTGDAFRVFEDGEAQSLAFFREQDSPVTVGLLIDGSGSMLPSIALVVAAVEAFVRSSHPQDEFFAMVFNQQVRPVMPQDTPFTSDAAVLRDALGAALVVRGRTALYDALSAGLAEAGRGTRERKALIVVSDGGDNASRTTFEQGLAHAQASNVVIYTVAIDDPLSREGNPKALRALTAATGGKAFEPSDAARVSGALQAIGKDIRSSYTLAYAPANASTDGRLRRVRVEARGSDGRALTVRTRTAYLSGADRHAGEERP